MEQTSSLCSQQTAHSEPIRNKHSWSFDSSDDREGYLSELSTDLDNSVYASEIAAVMNTPDSDSQHGSGLFTEMDPTGGSQDFYSDFDYIDDLKSDTVMETYIGLDNQDYSSGTFLIVPDNDNGGDSECEVSTQTVICASSNLLNRRSTDDTDDDEE